MSRHPAVTTASPPHLIASTPASEPSGVLLRKLMPPFHSDWRGARLPRRASSIQGQGRSLLSRAIQRRHDLASSRPLIAGRLPPPPRGEAQKGSSAATSLRLRPGGSYNPDCRGGARAALSLGYVASGVVREPADADPPARMCPTFEWTSARRRSREGRSSDARPFWNPGQPGPGSSAFSVFSCRLS